MTEHRSYSMARMATALLPLLVMACGSSARQSKHALRPTAMAAQSDGVCGNDLRRCRANTSETRARFVELQAANEKNAQALEFANRRASAYHGIAEKLRAVFEPGEITIRLREGLMVVQFPNEVLFDFGEATLRPEGKEVLVSVASVLSKTPTGQARRFLIAGNTDDRPVREHTEEYRSNWELSTLRALAAVDFLLEKGVPPELVAVGGYGEHNPQASNETPEGRAQNRRMEVIVFPTVDELPNVPDFDPVEVTSTSASLPPLMPEGTAPSMSASEPNALSKSKTPIFALSVGGGVVGFTDGSMRDFASEGGAWDVRLVLGAREYLAVEAAYTGASTSIDALGLDNSANLLSSGAEVLGRVNFLKRQWQPYIVAGVGWRHYSIINNDQNTSSVDSNEDLGEIPVGAGLSYRFQGMVLDARGLFRTAFSDDLVEPPPTGEKVSLDTWQAQVTAGWEF